MPGLAPVDALTLLGIERSIERGFTETVASYRERLRTAHQVWLKSGTAHGLLLALKALGCPNAAIEIVNGRQYTLDGDALYTIQLPAGSWLCSAYEPAYWSAFVVWFQDPVQMAPQAKVVFSGTGNAANLQLEGFLGPFPEGTVCVEVVSGANLDTGVQFKVS